MSFVHGKNTFISVDGANISTYTSTSEIEQTGDSHDVTTYGKNAHVKEGGLLDGKFTFSGNYDNTASVGPRPVLKPLVGTVVPVIRQPEGVGSGKPQDAFDMLLTKYVETNPVADMVTWSAEGEISDEVDDSPQGA